MEDDKPVLGSLVDVELKEGNVLVKCMNCDAKVRVLTARIFDK
jgi:hypothetical protein